MDDLAAAFLVYQGSLCPKSFSFVSVRGSSPMPLLMFALEAVN